MYAVVQLVSGHWQTYQKILLTNDNLGDELTKEDLYLEACVYHLHIFAHQISSLKHIITVIDSKVVKGW